MYSGFEIDLDHPYNPSLIENIDDVKEYMSRFRCGIAFQNDKEILYWVEGNFRYYFWKV